MKRFATPFLSLALLVPAALAEDLPSVEDATKGFEQVVSTTEGKSLYTVYKRAEDSQMLALLPKDYESKKYFIALTVASGETFAGLQANDMVVYWKRYANRLALLAPNLDVKSTGDDPSKRSVERLFTDRVLLDVPVVAQTREKTPLIDLDELLLGNATVFFGGKVAGLKKHLSTIKKAKAFPQNVELAFEVPMADGTLKVLHWSISALPDSSGYKPRASDSRIGYFTTSYRDLGKYKDSEVWVRYVNRWRLEKADATLQSSPPKEPIVFYIEHTTPIRYRRFVRDGILFWNAAFEKIGLTNAIEVYYQDATTGAHMEKDPEDVRYNFIRWLNNDVGLAIGPSRVDPSTGQILDADVVLTDGWIRHFEFHFRQVIPHLAMHGFDREAMAWLDAHPRWDPRIRCASQDEQALLLAERERRGALPQGGHPLGNVSTELLGDDEFDGLVDRTSQVSGLCLAASGRAIDLAMLRMSLDILGGGAVAAGEEVIDGVPSKYIGPLLTDLVAHEVGHTLGLRHNFRASGIYGYEEINSETGKSKPFAGSVMDYLPINFRAAKESFQGDLTMTGIGPYDFWAIEYGYGFQDDLAPILARCTEPALAYATDEDLSGPDPLVRHYDFGADPLKYAQEKIALSRFHREHLLDKFVKDGDSWLKAREGYELSLANQTHALSMMSGWLGGSFVSRAKKGNGEAPPLTPIEAARQREALRFVLDNSFPDAVWGLSPDLLRYLSVEKWHDGGGRAYISEDPAYPAHDRILAIQASILTVLLNPTTLRRVLDNETRTPAEQDALTLPEILEGVRTAAWSELESAGAAGSTVRAPAISSLRRNLQREHVERLIDLALDGGANAAGKTIATLARQELRTLAAKIEAYDAAHADAYTKAHLADVKDRIARALEASYQLSR